MTAENYLVNGVKLDNPAAGWRLLAATLPVSAFTMDKTSIVSAGRDGVVQSFARRGGVVPQFEVMVPSASWETLVALFAAPVLTITRDGVAGRSMTGSLKSSSAPKYYPRSELVSAIFYVDVPDGAWRGTESTSSLVPAAVGGAALTVFSGLSAPVQDALVRVKGPITNPEVTDASGAFFALTGSLTASQYLRFDSASGRAWRTTSDTWSGGDEVSGLVDYGGPRGVFEITPRFPSPADPTSRDGQLVLRQASFTAGSGFQVRGRSAHLL